MSATELGQPARIETTVKVETELPRSAWLEWITSVNHKQIGILHILTAGFFLCVGGVEAMLIRIQLAVPNNNFLSPEFFNQLLTMHGTTMVFLVGMPVLVGFANYMVPLMIGASPSVGTAI